MDLGKQFCRGCSSTELKTLIDLGMSPIANHFVSPEKKESLEIYYPLHAKTCVKCELVQLFDVATPGELFPPDYLYHSSYSSTWLEHSRRFVIQMQKKLNMKSDDLVIEVASNDGYLLQYFQECKIPTLGVEPAWDVAEIARSKGVETIVDFFGVKVAQNIAKSRIKAKLMIANNVLGHVPSLHDFIGGFEILLDNDGVATFEFPHILNLLKLNQFDTIYHEHYSYLSVKSLEPIFNAHGLRIFEVQELPTHGGSLRIFVCHENSTFKKDISVEEIRKQEEIFSPLSDAIVSKFKKSAERVKISLLSELIELKKKGHKIAAYGAAAKGNTLLNYVGIDRDIIDYVVDLNTKKQGMFLPGSRIPVVDRNFLEESPPDYLLILPWNLSEEIVTQLTELRNSGTKFLRAIPSIEYF